MREIHLKDIDIDNKARIDTRFKVDKSKVVFFSINVGLILDDKIVDVYRVDTAHDYPHEQKFWRSEKPIKLGDKMRDYKNIFHKKQKEVEKNYIKYIKWFKESKDIR